MSERAAGRSTGPGVTCADCGTENDPESAYCAGCRGRLRSGFFLGWL